MSDHSLDHLVPIMLGEVPFFIQNEGEANADVYTIEGRLFPAHTTVQDIRSLIEQQIEDPERFVINQERSQVNVYTRQPDAVIQLAVLLNRQKGVDVSEEEIENIRNLLSCLQH